MTHRRILTLGAVVVALAVHAGRADAAPTPRVAVLIGEVLGLEAADADALGASLATALNDKLMVDAIGGSDVARRLPPAGLPDECLSTPACVVDLGARLDADRLLVLAVVRAGAALQIDATMIVVSTGATAPRPRLQLSDLGSADALFAEAASRYLPEAETRVVVTRGGGSRRPITRAVWITGGVGLAALAGSGILGLTIKSKYDRCNDNGSPCEPSTKRSLHQQTVIADVTLGLGLAAVATAIVLYVRTPRETSDVQPAVSPVDGGAVVGVGGRF